MVTFDKVRPWVLPVVGLVVVVLLALAWNRSRGQTRALEKEREAARLEAAGISRAHELEKGQLLARVAELAAESSGLRSELARVQAAAPGARPVAVVSGTTGPQRVTGGPVAHSEPLAGPPIAGQPHPGEPERTCHLWDGEGLELRVKGVALETKNGNLIAVGTAQAVAVHVDGNEWPLVEAPLRLEIGVLPQSQPLGWGAGLVLVGARDGWWAGPILSPPTLAVLGLDLSVLLGAGAGPTGTWGGLAGALVRW